MRRPVSSFGLVIVSALLCYACSACLSTQSSVRRITVPLRAPESEIRNTILHHVALGATKEIVIAFVRDRLPQEGPPPVYVPEPATVRGPKGYAPKYGNGCITVHIGHYGVPFFQTGVCVQFAFSDDLLIEIVVDKYEISL